LSVTLVRCGVRAFLIVVRRFIRDSFRGRRPKRPNAGISG
jgi:hypothetical protein